MRFQCQCGAQYDFEVTPEMARRPLQFECSTCGADDPAALTEQVAQYLSGTAATPAADVCLKHGEQVTAQRCLVCQKPLCPRCLQVFGYVCSPRCADTAACTGLEVPVYEGHFAVVQARARRKARWIGVAVATGVAALAGTWAWYQFVGSKLHIVWSMAFPEQAREGTAQLIPPRDSLVLRNGRLARYDIDAGRERWSVAVPDDAHAGEFQRRKLPWHLHGRDLWVAAGDKLIRCDWASGEARQELALGGRIQSLFPGASLLAAVCQSAEGQQTSLAIDLATGEVRREDTARPVVGKAAPPPAVRPPATLPQVGSGPAPIQAARAIQLLANRPLPPETEEEEEAARLDDGPFDYSGSRLIGGSGNLLQLTVKLLESKTVTVQAMKAPSGKSALEGDVSAASTLAVINETLNEWQRERTGGVEQEDVSRYQVTLRRLLQRGAVDWTGEVVGPPGLFPLSTVSVLIAGKTCLVFDKTGRKAWEGKLAYGVSDHYRWAERTILDETADLASPCVEHDGALFIVDRGVLTCFDLASGNVRWRLPSVGISGLVFDDHGHVYLNTTDAAQERLRYAQQIDIESKTRLLILKVEARTGKVLWRTRGVGRLAKATGRFLYSVEWAGGDDGARPHPRTMPAHVRIHRLDPKDGSVLWEHYQAREPIALDFDQRTVQILFKKELQILKSLSF